MKSLNRIEDLTALIEQRVEEWIEDGDVSSAQDICSGWCCDFADPIYHDYQDSGIEILAIDSLEDAPDFGINDPNILKAIEQGVLAHTFLRFQGKYFDAEVSTGVDHPLLLPTFQRALEEACEVESVNFDRNDWAEAKSYCMDLC